MRLPSGFDWDLLVAAAKEALSKTALQHPLTLQSTTAWGRDHVCPRQAHDQSPFTGHGSHAFWSSVRRLRLQSCARSRFTSEV